MCSLARSLIYRTLSRPFAAILLRVGLAIFICSTLELKWLQQIWNIKRESVWASERVQSPLLRTEKHYHADAKRLEDAARRSLRSYLATHFYVVRSIRNHGLSGPSLPKAIAIVDSLSITWKSNYTSNQQLFSPFAFRRAFRNHGHSLEMTWSDILIRLPPVRPGSGREIAITKKSSREQTNDQLAPATADIERASCLFLIRKRTGKSL